ncbi:MAG: VOC family protein [Candidatus Binataceae bacterium]|jgi:catechol 2,3-dioxygenase-like lactoylglutathione lyase family enzyme
MSNTMSTKTTNKGFSHVGLSTLDLDKTREFYEKVLGFKVVVADTIKIKEGGAIRHIFFDTGRDQLLAFMEPRGIPGVPVEYDAGINRGLGTPAAFYHFAFEAGSPPALEDKRRELIDKGVQVTDVVDHGWAKSIYFKDPNGMSLEYCCLVRNFTQDDATMQDRFEISIKALGLDITSSDEINAARGLGDKSKHPQ